MGSTNFLTFNPTQANQETDAEYLADATRLAGALDGNAWPDSSANKTLYQVSTMVSALAQMMANKGFTMSDANYTSLVAQLANILTSVDLRLGLQNLAWSSTITLTVNKFLGFAITLTSSATLAVTGPTAGDMVVMLYTQGSAGGSVVTFPGNFYGASQPDPTPNVTSGQIFMVDAALNFWAVGALISPTGINNTPIGASAPATGNFSTLQVASAAPSGKVLTGNGTSYVPQTAPGFSNGISGGIHWRISPDGFIEQWANNVALPSIGDDFDVSFLGGAQAFTSTPNVQVACVYPSGNTGYLTINSVSTSGFVIHQNNIGNMAANWQASGY